MALDISPISPLASGLVTLALTPPIRWLLTRRGVVDAAGHRSSHSGAVPRGGGLALLLGIAAGAVLAGREGWGSAHLALLIAGFAIASVGALDDLRGGLGALTRLLAVGGVGLAAAVIILDPGSIGQVCLAVAAAVGVLTFTNAVNFMDGINSISALHGVVFGLSCAYVANDTGERPILVLALALAAASAGFLPWNVRGRIFLGDVGSYAIGGVTALLVVVLLNSGAAIDASAGFALPYLADTGMTLARRWRQGESLLLPHRSHTYQQLARRWGAHGSAALLVASLSAACAALNIWGSTLPAAGRIIAIAVSCVVAITYAALPSLTRIGEDNDAEIGRTI